MTVTRADQAGACDPATATTTSYGYDTADRLLVPGDRAGGTREQRGGVCADLASVTSARNF